MATPPKTTFPTLQNARATLNVEQSFANRNLGPRWGQQRRTSIRIPPGNVYNMQMSCFPYTQCFLLIQQNFELNQLVLWSIGGLKFGNVFFLDVVYFPLAALLDPCVNLLFLVITCGCEVKFMHAAWAHYCQKTGPLLHSNTEDISKSVAVLLTIQLI